MQEQYWRIPADMTPTQLDEAIQALQPCGCHDNININQSDNNEEPSGGGVQEEENETVHRVVDEPQVEDGTPPDEDTITDHDNDNGAQSDSSEHSGLCIDYHSDSATEGILFL